MRIRRTTEQRISRASMTAAAIAGITGVIVSGAVTMFFGARALYLTFFSK